MTGLCFGKFKVMRNLSYRRGAQVADVYGRPSAGRWSLRYPKRTAGWIEPAGRGLRNSRIRIGSNTKTFVWPAAFTAIRRRISAAPSGRIHRPGHAAPPADPRTERAAHALGESSAPHLQ